MPSPNRITKLRLLALSALALAVCGVLALSGSGRAEARSLNISPFTDSGVSLAGVNSGAVAWGDYNGDGHLDFVLTGAGNSGHYLTKLYANDGSGNFSEDTTADALLPGVQGSAAAWGDYNGDGRLDLLLVGLTEAGRIAKIYRGQGDGSFVEDTTADANLAGVHFGSAAWADFNSDGRPDILIAGDTGSGGATKIYLNKGNGTFSEDTQAGLAGVFYSAVAVGDYNADGRPDILLDGHTGSSLISAVYHNNGDGSFTNVGAALPGVYSGAAAWGDYNSDGKLDIALAGDNGSGYIGKVYTGNGKGGFADSGAVLPGVFNSALAWGDYDSDGRPDLLLVGGSSSLYARIYHNDGGGAFTDIGAGLSPVNFAAAAWGDYNSDGKLDALVTGYNSVTPNISRLYQNTGSAADTAPTAPGGLKATQTGLGRVTLSWRAATDGQTAPAGLSYNLRVGKTAGGIQLVSPLSSSSGLRLVAQLGNAGESKTFPLRGLAPGSYYWSVQSIDSSYMASAFAGSGHFTVLPTVSIAVKPATIRACAKRPTYAKVTGQVVPAPKVPLLVTLEGRAVSGGKWKTLARVKTAAAGRYTFKKVGKGAKRSLVLRVEVSLAGGLKATSATKRLTVKKVVCK